MVKRYNVLVAVLFFISISAFPQSLKPIYGVEIASYLKKIDNYSELKSPALSGYIGIYTHIPFKNECFAAKFGTGLNFTSIHRDELIFAGGGGYDTGNNQGEPIVFPEINSVLTTLSVSAELRYYLFHGKPAWGNLYATLPVSFESKPFTDSWILRTAYKIMPGIGYCYALNSHLTIEASANVGWGYLKSNITAFNNKVMSAYSTSLRIGYSF